GGFDSTYVGGTGEWNGSRWIQVQSVEPLGRIGGAMFYDPIRARTVLFGGNTTGNDTWEWDGTQWTPLTIASSPSFRFGHAIAYDAARSRAVPLRDALPIGDTWEWDGAGWIERFHG